MLLSLVSTEFISKRYGEKTTVGMLVYLEPLPPVVHTSIRCGTVEQVVASQAEFSFLSAEVHFSPASIFQMEDKS